jgi:hypothetical protein
MTSEPHDFSPACWSWPPPTDADRERVRTLYKSAIDQLGDGILPALVMSDWQQERCAVCGGQGAPVEDHDHGTGLVRGYLCRGCNVAEGMNRYAGRVWREYRERNPASICGVVERYWDPLTKEFAEPAEPLSADRWKNHPMRGVGL